MLLDHTRYGATWDDHEVQLRPTATHRQAAIPLLLQRDFRLHNQNRRPVCTVVDDQYLPSDKQDWKQSKIIIKHPTIVTISTRKRITTSRLRFLAPRTSTQESEIETTTGAMTRVDPGRSNGRQSGLLEDETIVLWRRQSKRK